MADLSETQWEAIDAEILAERKISAIKLHRELTGMGLKDSKDAVDAREKYLHDANEEAFAVPGGTTRGVEWELIDAEILVRRKISAIKLYREKTGMGLKESKDAVEEREKHLLDTKQEQFVPAKAGCLGVIVIFVGSLGTLFS